MNQTQKKPTLLRSAFISEALAKFRHQLILIANQTGLLIKLDASVKTLPSHYRQCQYAWRR